jgi:AcrR family transcriptional regulator
VLDAALALFHERGYDGTSMDAIAERAGVSKPVVYACFDSKPDLFRALLDREEQRLLQQVAQALPDRPGDEPEETLRACLEAFLEDVAAEPQTYRVILGSGASDAVARRVERNRMLHVDVLSGLVAQWLPALVDAGEDALDSRLAAHVLVGVAEGAVRAVLSEPGRLDPQHTARALARLLVRGPEGLLS